MLRKFCRDRRGNYAMLTAIAMLPVMGAVALAVDYSEVSRQRQAAQNALDATNLAIALRYLDGTSEGEVRTFAQEYFEANFRPSAAADPKVSVAFPTGTAAGGTVKVCADLKYDPLFFPVVQALTNDTDDSTIKYSICSEVRLKNTLEVALVLDNSGSMGEQGFGSGRKRVDLLKDASKQLADRLAGQAGLVQQVQKPVQIGLVPFAASVNVGPKYHDAAWMDVLGQSPVHHENFSWPTMKERNKNKLVEQDSSGIFRKVGHAWNGEEGDKVTRFTLYKELDIDWQGCVEARPYPHNVNGTVPARNNPGTLFVPMFGPDETDKNDDYGRRANNNWLNDEIYSSDNLYRQEFMPKYFAQKNPNAAGLNKGPNVSCTTAPITPLTDVTQASGLRTIKAAIDAMAPLGATNVPQGIAWGWHVVSSPPPFTEGRDDDNKGNDKVVVLLTDGANTYYRPESVGTNEYDGRWPTYGNDLAHNQSTYSAYGYAKNGRIFAGTGTSGYYNDRYSRAMNAHMLELCQNAKDGNIILMTVALDLTSSKREEREQIESLRECASESKFRIDADGKPIKLFWNTRGDGLAETFKEIADELSNLRLVS